MVAETYQNTLSKPFPGQRRPQLKFAASVQRLNYKYSLFGSTLLKDMTIEPFIQNLCTERSDSHAVNNAG